MGSGKGRGRGVDVPLIMKIIALICCVVTVGLLVSSKTDNWSARSINVSNSLIYSTGSFIVILGFCFIWSLIKDPVDETFLAILLVCGCIWTIGAGIGVIIYRIDYKHTTHDYQLIGGILTLAAGVVMLVDAIHNFGVF
ncbi:unnamed protein product [Ceutorhynchus assimilis]|uniref:Uncharacterized protein n=1 Tax=Ceutorhynchus assimilis TaxID=467358 RepID=A0A9N9MR98_9CUCU|nr:unnamed protein product [Ceutorhynchus assimilis]